MDVLVNSVGGATKAASRYVADGLEDWHKQHAVGAAEEQGADGSVDVGQEAEEHEAEDIEDDAHESVSGAGVVESFRAALSSDGSVTRTAEGVPLVGQVLAGIHLLAGRHREAKRALSKSTKGTVAAATVAGSAVAGTALVGATGGLALGGAVGLLAGGVVGSAAGEVVGGASQAVVEATVYDDDDRKQIGCDYLHRSPAQWGAGVAVASTVGVVGTGVGLHVDHSLLTGRLEQKVAAELTETVAERTTHALVPGLCRTRSKRERELAALGGAGAAADTAEVPPVRRVRSAERGGHPNGTVE